MPSGVTQSVIYDELIRLRERMDLLEEKIDRLVDFVDKVEATLEQMAPVMEQVAPIMGMLAGQGMEVPNSMEGVNILGKSHD